MEIRIHAYTDRDKKIWFTSPSVAKYKLTKNGETKIIQIDTSHSIRGIIYKSNNKNALDLDYVSNAGNPDLGIYRHDRSVAWQLLQDIDTTIPDDPASSDYPVFVYLAQGETETDEPATDTWIFPPPETPLEFIERMSARLLHFTRRASVLRHEEPHLSSRSRRVCLDLDDRSEYVHRYDHSINLMRLPVGWLQLKINSYITRYENHKKRVAEAEAARRTPPVFREDRLAGEIETLLEKLETILTEEALLEHHETHDTDEWRNAHAERKIVLCNEDCSVGELIADINSFHTSNGVTHHSLAEKSFHDVAVNHWNEAKRTTFRKLVTERFVTLD